MFLRHRYQSPDALLANPILQRESCKAMSPQLARYSSAKLFERYSVAGKEMQSALRKRIEQYSFNLSDQIGEGYTSRVFKASKDNSSDVFAIKVVDLKKYTVTNREMLESQVNILKQLNHPNLIKCHDVFVTSNNCYIVTQYCEGGDLMALLKKHKKNELMPDYKAAAIIQEILAGFRYLADTGIIHRDLKPANIFFRNGVVKIADFGFAKRLQHLKYKESYNVGTPLYMPPEALVYSKYSLQSDIFSLGVLFYEILCGHTPWESRSEKQLITKMAKTPLVFPNSLSESLKEMLEGCLAINIAQRFTVDKLYNCEYVRSLFGNPEQSEISQSMHLHKSQTSKSTTLDSQQSKQLPSSTGHMVPQTPQPSLPTPHSPHFPYSSPSASPFMLLKSPHHRQAKKVNLDHNTNLILVQLNFCRFMYYLTRNRILAMKSTDKDKLNWILHRHILKVIEKLAAMDKSNTFKLPNYEEYVMTNAFGKIRDTILEYSDRYKKEFSSLRSKQSVKYIRLIEDDLDKVKQYDQSGQDKLFYQEIQTKVREISKDLIGSIDYECDRSEDLSALSPSIQGLKSILKYLSLLRIMVKHFEDFEHFMNCSSITVLTDYNKSNMSNEDYQKLKALYM